MQLQMETCNLDECDFLETRFLEYDDQTAYLNDGDFKYSANGDFKGIILYFSTDEGRPSYVYKPLDMDYNDFIAWETHHHIQQTNLGNIWIKNIYWKLDEVSCVLVLRNQKWFNDNVNKLQEIWNIILEERITGYEHRKPVKRVRKNSMDSELNECWITLDKETGKTIINR